MWKAWTASRLFGAIRNAFLTSTINLEFPSYRGVTRASLASGTDLTVPSRIAESPGCALREPQRIIFPSLPPLARGFSSQRGAKTRDEDEETNDQDETLSDMDLFEESSSEKEAGVINRGTRKYRVKRFSADDSTESDKSSTEEDEISTDEDEESKYELDDDIPSPLDKAAKTVANREDETAIRRRLSLWIRIRKCVGRNKSSAKEVIEKWKREGNDVTREAIVTAITHLRRSKKYPIALQVSDWVMNEKPFHLTELDYSFRLELISKVQGLKKAEEYFAKIPKEFQSQMAYSILIMAYVERVAVTKAENVIQKVEKLGLKVSVFMYNQMLMLYRRKGKTNQVAELVRKMEENHVDYDTFTYNVLLDLKARKGDAKGLETMMLNMEENGVKPDGCTYCMLAKGYLAAGLTEKAEKALQKAESISEKIGKNRIPYYHMLQLYADMGKLTEIESVWKKMLDCRVTHLDDYVKVIEAFGKIGQVERAEEIFKEMWHSTGGGRLRQLNALLSVYTKQGMISKAEKLVKQMSQESLCPNCITFHYLVQMYAKLGLEKKVLEVMGKLEENMVTGDRRRPAHERKPWYLTLQIILQMFAEKGDVSNAERAFNNMKIAGYEAPFRTYLTLLNTYAKAGVAPYGFVDRMRADGNMPNSHVRSMLKELKGT